MPTAFEFERAATLFDQAAAELESILSPSRQRLGPDTVSGGKLGLVIAATLDAAEVNVRRSVEDVQQSADLCRQRAADCLAYGAALNRHQWELAAWQSDVAANGTALTSPPQRPPKPAAWIDL